MIVEPDAVIRQSIQQSMPEGVVQTSAEDWGVSGAIRRHNPTLVIIGPSFADVIRLPAVVACIRACAPHVPLLLVTRVGSEELAVAALRAGVTEYLRHPYGASDLEAAFDRCHNDRRDNEPAEMASIIGESKVMQRVREYLTRAAATNSTILITGETGTGKELAAEFVHRASPRRNHPLITINCAAIPDSLLESELFGYEQGAFTGAQSSRDGKLRAAHGGTVFLDEIGDMSLLSQAKILRVIDGKGIQKLGRNTSTPLNVRIIAATNREIEALVAEEKFRKDLFYRLNVARVHLPPLRERKEDIPAIVSHYMQELNHQFGRVCRLTDRTWDCLLSYYWPGNVRELKNLLEASFLQGSSVEISSDQLPPALLQSAGQEHQHLLDEQRQLLSALLSTNWNKSRAAEKLRWSRMTLYRKIAKYGVSKAASEGSTLTGT